jgi:flavorubredoxin
MKAFTIKGDIYWVGAVDWNPPKFGESLSKGTTYNSYLICDEKTALIDTVKHGFTQETVLRISDIKNLSDIDYIILGNYHMDHSGSLPFLIKRAKNATIIGTEECKKAIEKYHNGQWKFKIVKDGDILNLGKRTLHFKEFKLNSDNILLTYSNYDKILFSEDLFSQHIASDFRIDSNLAELENDALSYFANYLMPIEALPDLSRIDTLAPNHGVVWFQNTGKIVEKYQEWIKVKSGNKVTILYSSIWRGTEKMAYAIADGVQSTDTEVQVINYVAHDPGYILTKLFESSTIAFGFPSLKTGIPPELSKLLYYIELIGLKKKSLALFTCYTDTRSPIDSFLKLASMINFELVEKPLEVQYAPNEEELKICFELGKGLGEKTKNNKEQ